MKATIIRLIILCLILVLIFPLFLKNLQGAKINFESNEENNGSEAVPTDTIPVMLAPDFYGQDRNNKPYNISAKSAVSVSEDKIVLINITGKLELQDKSKVFIKSEQGNYFQKKQELTLAPDVELKLDKGYNLKTNSAYINLKENFVTGGDEVKVTGVMGEITSHGFIIKNSGDEIQFYGGVDLNTYVDKKEGKN